jgi:lipopolysaccharide transport system ATP-binding protein
VPRLSLRHIFWKYSGTYTINPRKKFREDVSVPEIPNYGGEAKLADNIRDATGWTTGVAHLERVEFLNLSNPSASILKGGERVRVIIYATAHQDLIDPILGFLVRDRLGQDLFGENTLPATNIRPISISAGRSFYSTFDFELPMLPNGQYTVMASVATGTLTNHIQHHYLHDACILDVASSSVRWGLVGLRFENIDLKIE